MVSIGQVELSKLICWFKTFLELNKHLSGYLTLEGIVQAVPTDCRLDICPQGSQSSPLPLIEVILLFVVVRLETQGWFMFS